MCHLHVRAVNESTRISESAYSCEPSPKFFISPVFRIYFYVNTMWCFSGWATYHQLGPIPWGTCPGPIWTMLPLQWLFHRMLYLLAGPIASMKQLRIYRERCSGNLVSIMFLDHVETTRIFSKKISGDIFQPESNNFESLAKAHDSDICSHGNSELGSSVGT